MRHPKKLKDGKSLESLALEVSNLRYDSLSRFLHELAKNLERSAEADKKRGRGNLAYRLYNAAEDVYNSQQWIDTAWYLCSRYMKGDDEDE